MAEYYNTQTCERRYSYNKPAGNGWVRADQLHREGWGGSTPKNDDYDDSGPGIAIAAVEVGTVLAGLFDSGTGDAGYGGSDFTGSGGDFGGGGASGDF